LADAPARCQSRQLSSRAGDDHAAAVGDATGEEHRHDYLLSRADGLVVKAVRAVAVVLGVVLVYCALGVRNPASSAAQQKPLRPNILLIQADDLGYGDLSAYGQARFSTPSIDRLAHEGIRFDYYYAGSTVCAPSRAALMTGIHTGHAWIR